VIAVPGTTARPLPAASIATVADLRAALFCYHPEARVTTEDGRPLLLIAGANLSTPNRREATLSIAADDPDLPPDNAVYRVAPARMYIQHLNDAEQMARDAARARRGGGQ
jgi:hypothetical protein